MQAYVWFRVLMILSDKRTPSVCPVLQDSLVRTFFCCGGVNYKLKVSTICRHLQQWTSLPLDGNVTSRTRCALNVSEMGCHFQVSSLLKIIILIRFYLYYYVELRWTCISTIILIWLGYPYRPNVQSYVGYIFFYVTIWGGFLKIISFFFKCVVIFLTLFMGKEDALEK